MYLRRALLARHFSKYLAAKELTVLEQIFAAPQLFIQRKTVLNLALQGRRKQSTIVSFIFCCRNSCPDAGQLIRAVK